MNPRFYIIMILPRLFPPLPAALLIFLCLLSDPSSRLEPRKSRKEPPSYVFCVCVPAEEAPLHGNNRRSTLLAGLDPSVFGEYLVHILLPSSAACVAAEEAFGVGYVRSL